MLNAELSTRDRDRDCDTIAFPWMELNNSRMHFDRISTQDLFIQIKYVFSFDKKRMRMKIKIKM